MESLIMEEVNDLIVSFRAEEGQPILMNEKFTIAVINALWSIIAGKVHFSIYFTSKRSKVPN